MSFRRKPGAQFHVHVKPAGDKHVAIFQRFTSFFTLWNNFSKGKTIQTRIIWFGCLCEKMCQFEIWKYWVQISTRLEKTLYTIKKNIWYLVHVSIQCGYVFVMLESQNQIPSNLNQGRVTMSVAKSQRQNARSHLNMGLENMWRYVFWNCSGMTHPKNNLARYNARYYFELTYTMNVKNFIKKQ